jgi:hypothetical protein
VHVPTRAAHAEVVVSSAEEKGALPVRCTNFFGANAKTAGSGLAHELRRHRLLEQVIYYTTCGVSRKLLFVLATPSSPPQCKRPFIEILL